MNGSRSLTRGQWFVLVGAFLGWMVDGVEMGIFPVVARPAPSTQKVQTHHSPGKMIRGNHVANALPK